MKVIPWQQRWRRNSVTVASCKKEAKQRKMLFHVTSTVQGVPAWREVKSAQGNVAVWIVKIHPKRRWDLVLIRLKVVCVVLTKRVMRHMFHARMVHWGSPSALVCARTLTVPVAASASTVVIQGVVVNQHAWHLPVVRRGRDATLSLTSEPEAPNI